MNKLQRPLNQGRQRPVPFCPPLSRIGSTIGVPLSASTVCYAAARNLESDTSREAPSASAEQGFPICGALCRASSPQQPVDLRDHFACRHIRSRLCTGLDEMAPPLRPDEIDAGRHLKTFASNARPEAWGASWVQLLTRGPTTIIDGPSVRLCLRRPKTPSRRKIAGPWR